MKNLNIYKRSSLFLLLPALLFSLCSQAQTRLTDGKITYSVKVDMPGGSASQDATNGQATFSFKNFLFRSEIKIRNMDYVNIHNSKDHSAVSLIDAGPQNKYLIHMNAEQLKEEAAKYKNMTFEDQPDTKTIAGYTCHKTIGKLDNGKNFTVYYTTKLLPPHNDYSPRFEKLKGMPLQFEINTKNNAKMTMTATKVDTGLQPSATFRTPTSGYRELTYDQLQKLRNNR